MYVRTERHFSNVKWLIIPSIKVSKPAKQWKCCKMKVLPLTWEMELRLGKKQLVPLGTWAGETNSYPSWKNLHAVNSSSWGSECQSSIVQCNCWRGEEGVPSSPAAKHPTIASNQLLSTQRWDVYHQWDILVEFWQIPSSERMQQPKWTLFFNTHHYFLTVNSYNTPTFIK